jgi:drug/metabolite transporter (DMT)-like permease
MLERIFRVLVGFVMACLAAGFTKVLFAVPPSEIYSLPPDVASDRMSKLLESGLFAAIWSAIFTFPFALVAAAIGEWRRIRDWTYYAIVGLAVSLVGFLTQHSAEQVGQPSIMNNYGLTAFITAGFMGGLFYWLFAGRNAGGPSPRLQPPAARHDERARPAAGGTHASKPGTPPKAGSAPGSGAPRKV